MKVIRYLSVNHVWPCSLPQLLLVLLLLRTAVASAQVTPASTTLREYLTATQSDGTEEGLYLAMAPAFFGYYGYFGALAGMEDKLLSGDRDAKTSPSATMFTSSTSLLVERKLLRGISGASAGAMVATTLAAGISPHRASEYVIPLGLSDFADPGGLGGLMKGDRFEALMFDFLQNLSPIVEGNVTCTDVGANTTKLQCSAPNWQLRLEDALVPVAVSTTDLYPQIPSSSSQTMQIPSWQHLARSWSYMASIFSPTAKILTRGSMARAARASACFPLLFQPVGWIDRDSKSKGSSLKNSDGSHNEYSLLIDGGLLDGAGCNGLKEILSTTRESGSPSNKQVRVLNLAVGGFGPAPPPGPEDLSETFGVIVDSVFSLSIVGLPHCGPLAMQNGRLAMSAARRAIRDAFDRTVVASNSARDFTSAGSNSKQQHHFVLEIDASSFVDEKL